MRTPPALRRLVLIAAVGGASTSTALPLLAEDAPPAASTAAVSATSQCVEGPGAPPSDPSRVTRVVPGASPTDASPAGASPPPEPSLDEPPVPGAPARVLLEGGLFAGVSGRMDDPPVLDATRRAGLVLGGSLFVWPSRLLAFGISYAHTDLHRGETPASSLDSVVVDYETHTALAEARVVPIRFSSVALYAAIGAGLAWQTASLRASFVPVDGQAGGSFSCAAGSGAELAFRGAIGMKARLTRAVSLLLDASFLGYRLSADVLDGCAPGAGTAQTLVLRAGLTYDIDISRFVR